MVNTGREMHLWQQFFCFNKNDPRASVIKSLNSQKHGVDRKAHLGKQVFILVPRHHFTCRVCLGVDTCWMVIRCFKNLQSSPPLFTIISEDNFLKFSLLIYIKVRCDYNSEGVGYICVYIHYLDLFHGNTVFC